MTEALELSMGGDTYRNRYWSGNPGGHNKGKFKKLKKKCAKCGKTSGMLDIHHKSGSRKDLKTGKGLQVLCRSCHRKLHQGKPGGGESKGSVDRALEDIMKEITPIGVECSDVVLLNADEIDNKAFAQAGLTKQKDLLYIRFVLAHEGTNKNQDHFTREELKAAASSPMLKQINWEHGEPAIGTIYKSEYKELPTSASFASPDGKRARIECEGVVWKYKYPQYAKTMANRYNKGELTFSMETYFGKAECSKCNEIFESKDHGEGSYCDHLNYRHTAEASQEVRAARILRDNTFGGVACVANPADIDAGTLAMAKENRREEDYSVSDKMYSKEDLDKAIAEAIDEYKNESAVSEELDSAKAEAEKLRGELENASKTLDELKAQKESAEAELAEFKQKVEATQKLDARMNELAEAGLELPDKGSDEFDELSKAVSEYSDEGFAFFVKTVAKDMPFMKKKGKDDEEEEDPKYDKKGKKKEAKASVRVPVGGASASENESDDSPNTRLSSLVAKL